MSTRHPARFDEQSGRRSGEPRESRTVRDPRESRESRENREPRDSRDPREMRDSRDPREMRDPRGMRDTRDPRENRDPRDTRDNRAQEAIPRDPPPSRDVLSPRDTLSQRDILSQRDVPPPRGNLSPPQGRDTRGVRTDPRAPEPRIEPSRIESRIDPRGDPRIDPIADPRLMPRGEPLREFRGELRVDPRIDARIEPRDPRDFPGYRGDQIMTDPTDPRFASSRDTRDPRDRDMYGGDGMDIDQTTSGRVITYELDGTGISREVIQADICRYLGPDARCMFKGGKGAGSYTIRAYRQLTSEMVEDLQADSRRYEDELRRNRGPRTAYGDSDRRQPPGYGDLDRRQPPGPSPNISQYPSYPSRGARVPDDHDMDNYSRPQPPRTLFPVTHPQDYLPHYPVTTGAFSNLPMAAPEYGLGRGRVDPYSVPRSEYDMYAAGRGATIQSPNQGQFAAQQGIPSAAPYQDPRTGQIIYPPTSAGRGYDQLARHPGAADGRRH